jgi:hypothetical protein
MLLFALICTATALNGARPAAAEEAVFIGDRRELFVDTYLIDDLTGVELRLHSPIARGLALVHDEPWEGNVCAYHTVFQDGGVYRMYYRGSHFDEDKQQETHEQVTCYAESTDGINWIKPDLGLVEFNGSTKNNIILKGLGSHNFAPFLDANPESLPDEKYKALGSGKGGLYAFKSPDGIHWQLMGDTPVITDGAFDSQNLAFWDTTRGRYMEYHRDFRDGIRDIKTCTSTDFVRWSDPQWVTYGDAPAEHLYTNQITPYARAPHLFLGFPMRLVFDRNPVGHPVHEVSDGVFMTSRDGRRFKRWTEAFIRPGLQRDRWVNRNNMTAWGIVETESAMTGAPRELSIYVTEGYYTGLSTRLRRYSIRMDGFVSIHATSKGGEFTTRPLVFGDTTGSVQDDLKQPRAIELKLNYSTSAAGSIRCELLDAAGKPIPGYSLDECDEIYGDELDRAVSWNGRTSLQHLAGEAVRLRIKMYDADLYAIQFIPE